MFVVFYLFVISYDMAYGRGKLVAKDLSRDHKPDDPEESLRIRQWGGFVAPPREPGLSARVYLDKECTMIGMYEGVCVCVSAS